MRLIRGRGRRYDPRVPARSALWTPANRIGNGLTGWFEESVILNSSTVQQWTNQVPSATTHFTQGTALAQPAYTANDPDGNNRASHNYTGAQEMANSGTTGSFFTANAMTILAVVKPNAAVGLDVPGSPWRGNLIVGSNTSSFIIFSISSATRLFGSVNDGGQITAALAMSGATAKRRVTFQKTATEVQARENNSAPATAVAGAIGSLAQVVTIGRAVPGSGGDFANMKFFALLFFNVVLPDAELAQAEAYLAGKYGA